jgi:hypothetical protein
MNGDERASLAPPEPFYGSDTRNGEEVVLTGSGIRTSADMFRASQECEEARADGESHRQPTRKPRGPSSGECLAALVCLRIVGSYWGQDVIQHYQWTSRPLKFCKVLRTAVLAVPDLSEAIVKLNRLILRRHQIPGRRLIQDSASSISQGDLKKLAAWDHTNSFTESGLGVALPYRPVAAQELSDGFGFDKFGLLVRIAHAVALFASNVDAVNGSRPAALGEAGQADPIRDRAWQQTDVIRRGLPCVAAFACTDYKVQSRTLDVVALD